MVVVPCCCPGRKRQVWSNPCPQPGPIWHFKRAQSLPWQHSKPSRILRSVFRGGWLDNSLPWHTWEGGRDLCVSSIIIFCFFCRRVCVSVNRKSLRSLTPKSARVVGQEAKGLLVQAGRIARMPTWLSRLRCEFVELFQTHRGGCILHEVTFTYNNIVLWSRTLPN